MPRTRQMGRIEYLAWDSSLFEMQAGREKVYIYMAFQGILYIVQTQPSTAQDLFLKRLCSFPYPLPLLAPIWS